MLWANEQPRCTLCGHRRIFHYMMTASRRRQVEVPVPCSLPECDCLIYIPVA